MLNIYQVLPRYVGNTNENRKPNGTIEENGCGKFKNLNARFLTYLAANGYNAIWLTGVIMHATKTDYSSYGIRIDHPGVVKGQAGSPYAIKDYYDVDPDLSSNPNLRMDEFQQLVGRIHRKRMKLIIDFVPNHVARQYGNVTKRKGIRELGASDDPFNAFSPKNNFYYLPGQEFKPQFDALGYYERPAKATGNDVFSASPSSNDWYETVKLNYGVDYSNGSHHFSPIPDTWRKMTNILLYWAELGVDGFRCDMAEMVPVEFWAFATKQVRTQFPKTFFIAEVYNPSQYRDYISRGGFDYLYDKVGLYDTLKAVNRHEAPASDITKRWLDVDDIRPHMLNFLENHDEQRIASEFFLGNGLTAVPSFVVSALLSNGPFMTYFAQEIGERGMYQEGFSGQDGRTSIFDYWSIDSFNRLYGNGDFTLKALTEDEKRLLTIYKRIMVARLTLPAFADDSYTYDLQYLQQDNPDYSLERQFVFVRWKGNSRVLVIANFDDKGADIAINFNYEIIKKMGLHDGKPIRCHDILSLHNWTHALNSNQPVRFQIDAYSALVIELK